MLYVLFNCSYTSVYMLYTFIKYVQKVKKTKNYKTISFQVLKNQIYQNEIILIFQEFKQ
jgi:hypothetical protein